MKKLNFIFATSAIVLVSILLFTSCGGTEKQEESKSIPAAKIKMSGTHKNMLKISTDSIKIMLVCTDKGRDEWDVKTIIPMSNEQVWSEISPKSLKGDGFEYEAKMGNLTASYLDANGLEIDFKLHPTWDVVTSILSSETITTEDVSFGYYLLFSGSTYEKAKEVYDKVTNLSIKNIELNKIYTVSESSSKKSSSKKSSSYDYDSDDFDKAVEQAEKALETYEKTLDALDKLEDLNW